MVLDSLTLTNAHGFHRDSVPLINVGKKHRNALLTKRHDYLVHIVNKNLIEQTWNVWSKKGTVILQIKKSLIMKHKFLKT